MKNHEEMFQAFLKGETLASPIREYRMINGKIHSLDLSEYGDGRWVELQKPPKYESVSVKPKTININGFEVPEPLRAKPNEGDDYWCVYSSYEADESFVAILTWDDDRNDNRLLEAGLIHETRAAAQLHAQALLSFTKPKED